ncbi:putative transcriptional regulatory protein C1F7.11c [Grifola frondosa]|uniref:Putative transcriptional regulatory protein C1F7.11c n=1 Tax=Grifola frondosa TaxID=5627 RepID=A0A1C7M3A6_GRIFR|nr:putative transcriptional regulatory protein C1F7.11c [Grifola frondosa]
MMNSSIVQDDHRPFLKRPRTDNDVGRPYTVVTLPSNTALLPDPDGSNEGGTKKNRKRPLSCGECRRLKLKCDRIFPCQSCCKRGCAEICPEGALTGGKGSRFILANTEQLHDKIKSMSKRIRELEEALHVIQSQHSTDPHPLLRPELLLIKKSPELFGVDPHLIPPPVSDNARQDENGHNAVVISPKPSCDNSRSPSYTNGTSDDLSLPEDILRLSDNFPAPWSIGVVLNPELRQRIHQMLPSPAEAEHLCQQALLHTMWHDNSDGSVCIPNLIHSIYKSPIQSLLPARLSYFLIVLAIGTAVDPQQRSWRAPSERYHQLARAAVCESSVIDEPSTDVVNALMYMVWYLVVYSNSKHALEHAWGIMGLCGKLALSLGLHREAIGSKVIPEELDKRRTLLWSLLFIDMRLTPKEIYLHWLHGFMAESMAPALELVVGSPPPLYSDVVAMDIRIREFYMPPILQMVSGPSAGNSMNVVQRWAFLDRELALLNLHRGHYVQALTDGFTSKHTHMPSTGARVLHSFCHDVVKLFLSRDRTFSSHISRAGVLSVGSCPSKVAKVMRLFLEVKDRSPIAEKALPVLETMLTKCRSAYLHNRFGTLAECDAFDEMFAIARRLGVILPDTCGIKKKETDPSAQPFANAHPCLMSCYEQAVAEVTHLNDPVLVPGQLRLAPILGTVRRSMYLRNVRACRTMCMRPRTVFRLHWGQVKISDV